MVDCQRAIDLLYNNILCLVAIENSLHKLVFLPPKYFLRFFT